MLVECFPCICVAYRSKASSSPCARCPSSSALNCARALEGEGLERCVLLACARARRTPLEATPAPLLPRLLGNPLTEILATHFGIVPIQHLDSVYYSSTVIALLCIRACSLRFFYNPYNYVPFYLITTEDAMHVPAQRSCIVA